MNGDDWFADMIAHCRDPSGGDSPDDAVVYEHLQRAMQATLDGPLEAWVVTAWNRGTNLKTLNQQLCERSGSALA